MEKIEGVLTLIERNIDLRGKVVADVGCGMGAIAAAMAQLGSTVYAIDTHGVIEKAKALPLLANIHFYEDTDNWLEELDDEAEVNEDKQPNFDLVLFSASLHHIPANEVMDVLQRYTSKLKEGGLLMFIEPVNLKGHYIELTSLIEEERDKLMNTYAVIKALDGNRLTMIQEGFYYLERTTETFKTMATEYIIDPGQRAEVISHADEIVKKHLKSTPQPTIFRSVVRLNLFKKVKD